MRILVSGGAGFIGSHLTDALAGRGHAVVVLDDLSSGSLENLRGALGTGRVEFHEGDVRDPEVLGEALEGVERVFHLAASVGVRNIIERPLHGLLNNVQGAAALLEACRRRGNVPLVLFSSSEVYGRGHGGLLREQDDTILGPTSVSRWSYAASKVVDEFLALNYHREHGLPVVIVRCFNTCGPRQIGRYGMVLPRLVGQALAGEPMTVYGDGRQSRCFSYVGDVVRGVLLLAGEPRARGEIFNIGNDEETTILDLARRIRVLTESRSEIRLVPYAEAYGNGFEDIRRRVPSLAKIRNLTGYEPQVGLGDLLVLTIRHIAGRMGVPIPGPVEDHRLPEVLLSPSGSSPAPIP